MNRIIYVPTIQHTGTWFLLEVLKMHPEVKALIEMHLLKSITLKGVPIPQTMYNHESFSPDGVTLVHQHIPLWEKTVGLYSPGQSMDSILFAGMVCACPTVLPLRDPLLGLLTARNRRAKNSLDLDTTFLVHIWAQTARDFMALNEVARPYYFPIDLLSKADVGIRLACMKEMMEACWLPVDGVYLDNGHLLLSDMMVIAREWGGVNVTKGPLDMKKQRYIDGDTEYFKEKIPAEWEELRKAEPLLRPFLERFGYTNLLWWS